MTRHQKRKPRQNRNNFGAEPLPWVSRLFKLAKRFRSVDPSRRSPTRQTTDFANRSDWQRANFDHAIHCNAIERFASKNTTGKPLINYERPGIVRNRRVGVKLNFLELKIAISSVFFAPGRKTPGVYFSSRTRISFQRTWNGPDPLAMPCTCSPKKPSLLDSASEKSAILVPLTQV